MTPKEKAQELVDKFKDYVHGYVGSSMLTNHEYPEQILAQAKKVAKIAVNEILYALNDDDLYIQGETNIDNIIEFYQEVKSEIEKL